MSRQYKIVPYDTKCPNCGLAFVYEDIPESGMSYIECPQCGNPMTQKDILLQKMAMRLEQQPWMEKPSKYPTYRPNTTGGKAKNWDLMQYYNHLLSLVKIDCSDLLQQELITKFGENPDTILTEDIDFEIFYEQGMEGPIAISMKEK